MDQPEGMRMEEESIVTVIDRLVDFVKLRKRTTVGEAARALGMTPGHAEKLGRLLEESGLLEVHYTLGGTELVAVQNAKVPEAVRDKTAQKKASAASASKGLKVCIAESESVFEFIEEDILKKMAAAEALATSLEKEDLDEAEAGAVKTELACVLAALADFEKGLARLAKREGVFRSRIAELRQRAERTEAGGRKGRGLGLGAILSPLNGALSAFASLPKAFRMPGPIKKMEARVEVGLNEKEERLKKVLGKLKESKRR